MGGMCKQPHSGDAHALVVHTGSSVGQCLVPYDPALQAGPLLELVEGFCPLQQTIRLCYWESRHGPEFHEYQCVCVMYELRDAEKELPFAGVTAKPSAWLSGVC